MKRKSLSKKTRFEVFKRDSFTCAYCGTTPPSVVLEIDHITPVAKGGDDSADNLITSCFDCNRGKSDRLLTSIPPSVTEKAEIAKEKEEQLSAFKKLQASIRRREIRDINQIEETFSVHFPDSEFTDKFKSSIRVNFLPKLSVSLLQDHMDKACLKCSDPYRAIKYFCGINWNVIKGEQK